MKLELGKYILEISFRHRPLTNSERTSKLYRGRKAKGLCQKCASPQLGLRKNGKRYTKCIRCRRKENESKRKKA